MADSLVSLFEHSDFAVGLGFEVGRLVLGGLRCSRRAVKPFDPQDLDCVEPEVVLAPQQPTANGAEPMK